nr:MAG TPA: hypothetical protein [Caudoviricetes sp.]
MNPIRIKTKINWLLSISLTPFLGLDLTVPVPQGPDAPVSEIIAQFGLKNNSEISNVYWMKNRL